MLHSLLRRIDRTKITPQVVSLVDLNLAPMTEKFQSLGLPLRSLGMYPGRPNPVSLLRLVQLLRKETPDLIHTWMYHADLLGGLAAKLAGGIPVAWGIRHCNLSSENNRWLTLQTVKACALMSSRLPVKIVCNSEASRKAHVAVGYKKEKMLVIRNGSDLRTFKPDQAAREVIRKELEISNEAPLIGLVGRFDPQKDHRNFIQAAALLLRERPEVCFLLCGVDVTWDNRQLARWIREAGIADRCHWLGASRRRSSHNGRTRHCGFLFVGESFANVIVEAMSCGVPCVVTDVGD